MATGAGEQHRREPLHGEPPGDVGRLPEGGRRVEHLGGTAHVCGAVPPVGDDGVQVVCSGQVDAPLVGGDPVHDPQSGVLLAELGQLVPEQGVVERAGGVHEHDVRVTPTTDERADHRHHRRETAAGGEHEQRPRVLG